MGRVAIVTGGGSGLGAATARAFAAQGMRVAVADIGSGRAAAVMHALPGHGHAAIALDVADEASVESGFDEAERQLGPAAVLAHFAGVIGWTKGARASIVDLTAEEWHDTFRVNAFGAFLCVRALLRRRRQTPSAHGRIILVGSSAAQMGSVNGSAAYGASKGAVLSLVKTAAREAAPLGITVNALAPGSIDTPMLRGAMSDEQTEAFGRVVPLGRIGRPEEVAAAAAFLASEAAGYITGACIDVNGGLRMQ